MARKTTRAPRSARSTTTAAPAPATTPLSQRGMTRVPNLDPDALSVRRSVQLPNLSNEVAPTPVAAFENLPPAGEVGG